VQELQRVRVHETFRPADLSSCVAAASSAGCLGRARAWHRMVPWPRARRAVVGSWLLQALDSRMEVSWSGWKDMTERNPVGAVALRRATASQRRRRSRDDQGWTVAELPTDRVDGYFKYRPPLGPFYPSDRRCAGEDRPGIAAGEPVVVARQARGGCKAPWRRRHVEVRRSRA
jgi:hypothetical protein